MGTQQERRPDVLIELRHFAHLRPKSLTSLPTDVYGHLAVSHVRTASISWFSQSFLELRDVCRVAETCHGMHAKRPISLKQRIEVYLFRFTFD